LSVPAPSASPESRTAGTGGTGVSAPAPPCARDTDVGRDAPCLDGGVRALCAPREPGRWGQSGGGASPASEFGRYVNLSPDCRSYRLRIVIDKAVTGDDQHGEIVVYGPNVMQGYHNRPDENAAVLMPDGGFRSGDMGYLAPDGYLYITGRIKEQYKLETGKYVVPSPLEEELKLSPYIANVMVHGANKPFNVALIVPDAEAIGRWIQDNGVDACDVTKDERVRALIADEIKKHSGSFKSYERPEKFLLVSEDFTTDNGMLTPTLKLKRRSVLARYEKQLEALY